MHWLACLVSRCGKDKMQKLTMEQAVVVSAYTGFLVCPFDQMHAEIEKRLGRPVWTHEMGSEKFMDDQVRPAFKADFVAMLPANAEAHGRRSRAVQPLVGTEVV
jgi:hypothetical protein